MNHPLNLKRQLRCIYLSDFFSGLRITDAVWVALLAARGFSLLEIGLAKSIYYTVSLLAEIPSGMAADLFGRKRALVLGGVLVVAYNLLIAFAPVSYTHLTLPTKRIVDISVVAVFFKKKKEEDYEGKG